MHDAVTDWQELSALYEQADLLPVDQLEPWLATLRAKAHPLLEPLLQMLGARSEILDNGFLDALPSLPSPAVPLPAADWQAGVHIGPYRLERPLGTGGMAEVWMAQRDDGAFQRTVAIKLLFRHAGGGLQRSSFAQRFSRERDILASLHHPHIAALHDAGVTPAGQPWLALEYVEGEPLTTWCDRARLDVRGRVELFLQVLLAVQHAHANLVIHRDLKPANILVTTAGEVRLLDFGIAKLMEEGGESVADTELTRHAGRLMTVRYASPEQLAGQPLTTACDVYSLGVVLYELLCGELPYETKVDSAAQLEQAILDVEPRAPSRRLLSPEVAAARESTGPALRKLLGSDLDAIVLRALAKLPAQRYASVEALRAELERWLAGEPVEARAPSSAYRLRKFAGRHVVGVSLGSAALVALIVVAATAVWLGLQARQESARATAARDFMMGMFKQADSDKSHGADMTARQLLDRGRDDVLKRLSGQPELQADLLEGIAGIQAGMEEYTKADLTWDRLAETYHRLRNPRKEIEAIAARADNALRMDDHKLAHELLLKARKVSPELAQDTDINSKLSLTEGWLALYEGQPKRSQDLFREAVKRDESAFGALDRRTLTALVGLVRAQAGGQDFDAAIKTETDFEQRSLRAPDRTARELIGVDVEFAELLYLAGRYRDAAERGRSAMTRCNAAVGTNDSWCRRLTYDWAAVQLRRGDADSVRGSLSVLNATAEDSSSPELQRPAQILLMRLYCALHEMPQHQTLLKEVIALANDENGSFDPARRVQALQALAETDLQEERLLEAQVWLDRAIALQAVTGDQRPGYSIAGVSMMLEGAILSKKGETQMALVWSRQALESVKKVLGENHPTTVLFSLNVANVLATLGQYPEAKELTQRAEISLRQSLGSDSPVWQQVFARRIHLEAAVNSAKLADESPRVSANTEVNAAFFLN